ncbi:MAG TPA: carboxypeptidase-like regulatory domain-containing protein [Candidatus Limnocylindrales bacterium]|nr:carboxypeptidase-like regulatory domain-containing protein [Candidatus Limnocylindrales bacterium]
MAPLSAAQTAATPPSPTAQSLAEGTSATSSGATPVQGSAAAQLGGARPSAFSTIQGNALRATGAALARATVRLRDARFGRIAGTQTSDQSGLFAFSAVDPGVYVVEIVGEDGSVLAASQMLNVTAGDTASTAVRLPFRALPLGGVFGDSTPAAAIVAAEAAAAGVLTTTTTQPVSPTQ